MNMVCYCDYAAIVGHVLARMRQDAGMDQERLATAPGWPDADWNLVEIGAAELMIGDFHNRRIGAPCTRSSSLAVGTLPIM